MGSNSLDLVIRFFAFDTCTILIKCNILSGGIVKYSTCNTIDTFFNGLIVTLLQKFLEQFCDMANVCK